jgi:hypothetical protein
MTQFGGVLFASFVNNKFDSSPKQWRMLSACALECSSFIEMCTLLCPQYFLLLASVANIGKVVSVLRRRTDFRVPFSML